MHAGSAVVNQLIKTYVISTNGTERLEQAWPTDLGGG